MAFSGGSEKIKDTFNRGFAAFERGNTEYAIELFLSCIQTDPSNIQARKYLRYAEIKRYLANKNPVLRMIKKWLAYPYYLRSITKLKSGKKESALMDAEFALKDNPLEVTYIKQFVESAISCGFIDIAIQTLEIAREHLPNDLTILNCLGTLYQKVGRTRAARECFERLCEISPNDPSAIKALKDAMALESLQEDGWERAAVSGGSYRDLLKDEREAEILERESKEGKTVQDVEFLIMDITKRLEKEPENINYLRVLANLYANKKDFVKAKEVIAKAIKLNPTDPELDATIARITLEEYDSIIEALHAEGKIKEAEDKQKEKEEYRYQNLMERVKRYPNDSRLKFDLGTVLYNRKEINEAIRLFQQCLRNPELRVKALYYLGLCFKEKNQYDLSIEQFKTAVNEYPNMDELKKEILYEMGLVYEILNQPEEATNAYKRVYQVDIGFHDIAERIDRLYKKQHNT